jgi:pyroglutamyl-peptidase
VVLPVHPADTASRLVALLAETTPEAILHLGLAAGRARVALERVAINAMDYEVPDNAGYRASGEPCIQGGPTAYFSTLPLPTIVKALVDEGIPAYTSNTAGTYLCNQTLYWTLHAVRNMPRPPRVGFIHFPLLPAMVAATGLEQASMDFPLMLRAVETVLGVIAHGDGQAGRA